MTLGVPSPFLPLGSLVGRIVEKNGDKWLTVGESGD